MPLRTLLRWWRPICRNGTSKGPACTSQHRESQADTSIRCHVMRGENAEGQLLPYFSSDIISLEASAVSLIHAQADQNSRKD